MDISLISPLGVELALATDVDDRGSFRLLGGASGFGLPTPSLSSTESAGDGRRVGNVRTSGRLITLPVLVLGATRAETEANLDRLADHISYIDGKPFPKIRVTYPDGKARETAFIHTGGGVDGLTDAGETEAFWVLTLDCPDPYWTATEYATFTVQQTAAETPFLGSLPNVYLMPSATFGAVSVANPGRVESWVDWELQGPFTQVTADGPGGGWTFTANVLSGETVFIRKTASGIEVVDQTGANRFPSIGAVPYFFRLPAGNSALSVAVSDSTSATKVIGRYKPRYRLVF